MIRTSAPALVAVVVALVGACVPAPTSGPVVAVDEHDAEAAGLESYEQSLRPAVRARLLAGGRADHGADPVALGLAGEQVVVLLQGRDRLQLVGGASAQTEPFPSALAMHGDHIVVGSAVAGRLQYFSVVGGTVSRDLLPRRQPGFFWGVSALATDGTLVDVGTLDGDVVVLKDWGHGKAEDRRCRVGLGISSLQRLPHHLVALSSLEHRVVVFPLDDQGLPVCSSAQQQQFDGLLFAQVATEGADGVDVVVSGIEDHPLDRSGGSFGNIDSFLFGLRFEAAGVEVGWRLNLSERGVVNGKALLREGANVVVWGAGSGRFAVVDAATGSLISTGDSSFGVNAAVTNNGRRVVASALEDAVDVGGTRIDLGAAPPGPERVGERLVFTTMMAPQQSSEGALSRFTCESCHLGGGIDGRIHNTGRVDAEGRAVTATTKPLWGLFQNPPLFTRALDRSVAVMVHAEFRVANARSPQSPWFSSKGNGVVDIAPLDLRRAMIAFFASFDPPPNARAWGRTKLDDDEALGLADFNRYCVSCHAARVFADDKASVADVDVVPALFHGALVFGRAGREDTGVRPRVHPDGARPSSLRGIGRKTPLLTSGRARNLPELLEQVRIVDVGGLAQLTHEGTEGRALTAEEQTWLLRFLRLL